MADEMNYAVGDVDITDTPATPEVEVQETVETPAVETPVTPSEPVVEKYKIDNEEFTVDELREFRKGNLRQSDYTRKTQELANERKRLQEAEELFNYLKSKPELVKVLMEHDSNSPQSQQIADTVDPVRQEIASLKADLHMKDLDAKLNEITSKDKYVKDVELLEIANSMRVDLDTAYTVWKGRNMDTILEKKLKETEDKLKSELAKNAEETKTLINPTDKSSEQPTHGLSDTEISAAKMFGMSLEEYAEFKNPKYKAW